MSLNRTLTQFVHGDEISLELDGDEALAFLGTVAAHSVVRWAQPRLIRVSKNHPYGVAATTGASCIWVGENAEIPPSETVFAEVPLLSSLYYSSSAVVSLDDVDLVTPLARAVAFDQERLQLTGDGYTFPRPGLMNMVGITTWEIDGDALLLSLRRLRASMRALTPGASRQTLFLSEKIGKKVISDFHPSELLSIQVPVGEDPALLWLDEDQLAKVDLLAIPVAHRVGVLDGIGFAITPFLPADTVLLVNAAEWVVATDVPIGFTKPSEAVVRGPGDDRWENVRGTRKRVVGARAVADHAHRRPAQIIRATVKAPVPA